MSDYSTVNILDMIEAIGEDALRGILSDFYCPNENNRFHVFSERYSDVDNTKYIQLLRFF